MERNIVLFVDDTALGTIVECSECNTEFLSEQWAIETYPPQYKCPCCDRLLSYPAGASW